MTMVIPEDVLRSGILERLPMKSAIRFKCVCKEWLSLIDHIDFPRSHLLHLPDRNNTRYIYTFKPNPFHLRVYSMQYVEVSNQAEDLTLSLPPLNKYVEIVNTCNGLLCLSDYKTFVSLWNPTTREYRKLPSGPPTPSPLSRLHRSENLMGLGCDVSHKEYKLLSIVMFYETPHPPLIPPSTLVLDKSNYISCKIKVQTLGTNSWRTVRDSPLRPFRIRDPLCSGLDYTLVNFKGALHWAGQHFMPTTHRRYNHIYIILSFDVNKEKFKEIPLPDVLLDDCHIRCLKVDVLQDCLSAAFSMPFHLDVWMMKDYGVKDSWTKVYSIFCPMPFDQVPLVFWNNGRVKLKQIQFERVRVVNPVNKACICVKFLDVLEMRRNAKVAYIETYISIASLLGDKGQYYPNRPAKRTRFS